MVSRRPTVVLMIIAATSADVAPTAVESSTVPAVRRGRRPALPLVASGLLGSSALVPSCRRAVRRLFDRSGAKDAAPIDDSAVSSSVDDAAADRADVASPSPSESAAASAGQPSPTAEAERFALTPDKLATIAELNPRLEAISPLLAAVPVFTAAVGNGTSPLTVPTEGGRKVCAAGPAPRLRPGPWGMWSDANCSCVVRTRDALTRGTDHRRHARCTRPLSLR